MSRKKRKEPLNDELISQIRSKRKEKSNFKLVQTRERNIIICGRKCVGKTTFIKILKDPTYQPGTSIDYSPQPEYHSLLFNDSGVFTLNIFEAQAAEKNEKEGILEQLEKTVDSLEREVDKIHCVLIFVNGGIIGDIDVQYIQEVMKLFKGVRKALVFTHMDGEVYEKKKGLVEQLQNHKYLRQYLKDKPDEFCHEEKGNERMEEILRTELKAEEDAHQDGERILDFHGGKFDVLFTGCVQADEYEDEEELEMEYEHICHMRVMLLRYIFSCWPSEKIRNLEIVENQLRNIRSLALRGKMFMEKMLAMGDSLPEDFKRELDQHEKDMMKLGKMKFCYFMEEMEEDALHKQLYKLKSDFAELERKKRRISRRSLDIVCLPWDSKEFGFHDEEENEGEVQ